MKSLRVAPLPGRAARWYSRTFVRMALTSTVYAFEIELADSDRQVYETLALRVARHPSESEGYLVARVLAYAMEYTEGIGFSRGLCDPEDPAIAVRDLTGAFRAWIDIGSPDAARLHRASKLSPRVAVYTHKDPANWLRSLSGERIHRVSELELYAIDRHLIAALVDRLDRRMAWSMSIAGREIFISMDSGTIAGAVIRHDVDRR
jgi:uncharacterized protein YaeQ